MPRILFMQRFPMQVAKGFNSVRKKPGPGQELIIDLKNEFN